LLPDQFQLFLLFTLRFARILPAAAAKVPRAAATAWRWRATRAADATPKMQGARAALMHCADISTDSVGLRPLCCGLLLPSASTAHAGQLALALLPQTSHSPGYKAKFAPAHCAARASEVLRIAARTMHCEDRALAGDIIKATEEQG
jgi:hypothetical protein